jgi:hypothetical protein
VRLRERHEVQVAIRFPEILDVAHHALIAVVDGAGAARRGHALRERIAVPLRRIAELAIREIEERVSAREHAIGGRDQQLG